MQFQTLTQAEYRKELFSSLVTTEQPVLSLYADKVGWATIGMGFKLSDRNIFDAVVNVLFPMLSVAQRDALYGVTSQNFGANNTTAARTAINAQMAAFHAINPAIPSTLVFTSSDQMISVYDVAILEYERRVDAFFKDVPPSHERAALVSLSYNGGLGPNLQKALQADNHAEAWYQIRYETNGGASRSSGLANRRYIEAHMFGIFGGETPTIEESRQAAQMYALHRDKILAYEALFAPETASKVKDFPGIFNVYQEFTPVVDALKAAYHLPDIKIEEVQMASSAHLDLNGDGTPYDTANNDQDLLIGLTLYPCNDNAKQMSKAVSMIQMFDPIS